MMKFNRFSIVVIWAVVGGCYSNTCDVDLNEIHAVVLNAYENNENLYFSNTEKCLFENYLNSKFYNETASYDIIYDQFKIKYFYCADIDYSFSIISGSDDKYYFVGHSDIKYFESLGDSIYTKSNGILKLNDSSLQIFKPNIITDDYFNELFENEKRFTNITNEVVAIKLASSLVYLSYMKPNSQYLHVNKSIFNQEVTTDNLKSSLFDVSSGIDTISVQKLYDELNPLTYFYLNKKLKLYYLNNTGLVGFNFQILNNKIILEEFLIPTVERKISIADDLQAESECD